MRIHPAGEDGRHLGFFRKLPGIGLTDPSLDPLDLRKLKSGEYRLYSRKKDPKTGKRRNLAPAWDAGIRAV